MLLPTKHLSPARSILGVGAHIMAALDRDVTVGEAWEAARRSGPASSNVSYEWFLVALSFLYATGQISYSGLLISRRART